MVRLESAGLADRDGAGDTSAAQAQIRSAIASLREAMSALRALHDVETSTLAFGFVLADPDWSGLHVRRRNAGGVT